MDTRQDDRAKRDKRQRQINPALKRPCAFLLPLILLVSGGYSCTINGIVVSHTCNDTVCAPTTSPLVRFPG